MARLLRLCRASQRPLRCRQSRALRRRTTTPPAATVYRPEPTANGVTVATMTPAGQQAGRDGTQQEIGPPGPVVVIDDVCQQLS